MNKKYRTAALLIPAIFALAACGGSASSSEDSSNENLTGGAVGPGFYEFEGGGTAHQWVQSINLHVDGSFEGDFGNDVSNLSGHHFLDNGTYKSDSNSITFTTPGAAGGNKYDVRTEGGALQLRISGADADQWFTLVKQPSPITLAFNADFTQSQSAPIKAGSTVLIRYAASRAQCHGSSATVTGEYEIDGKNFGIFQQPIFFANQVNGFYDVLFTIPGGSDIAFWFTSSDGGCNGVDSSFGKNYHFAITSDPASDTCKALEGEGCATADP